ncbi:MAG: outer membrane beta-barrel protein [Alphaproteobacteria bacterium]|uniref:OmpW/AlkL family protein n=1 Tax=Brevundimonas sp. TaxID=1871086 RepID=UPI0017C16DB4|nr:OmpW family outer membrane protein [Brevundimonas sp.]MBA3048426.1 outer membrane beta-barrel protein [Brevundimonas sp.]MBU4136797.1 outer membrane beta-barrel protein [Alphaproteobacteria bacterium]
MKRNMTLAAAVAVMTLATGAATGASAQNANDWQVARKGDWIVTGRITDVSSGADDSIFTSGGVDTGLNVDVGNSTMPTLGFTYFLTDNFSVEAILGTTQHEIRAQGPGTDVAVHETWVLPPVVTLQYRPMPEARVSPYVGAGINYMLFYSGEDKNGFTVDLEDGFGYALQAGADVALTGPWTLNVDVKKVWFDTEATVNGGALTSDVALDPWVVSVGFGRKF